MPKDTEVIPYTPDFWEHAPDVEPVALEKLNEQYQLSHPHMKAEELVGETFTIFGMRKNESTYDEQKYYYFCHCQDAKSKEVFTTSLGGQAVLDILDRIIELKIKEPFIVQLDFVKQGANEGYYIFR